MKRLEISKLMDDYVDDEFFPEGEGTAEVQVVKDRVLAQAAPKKRRRPSLKTGLLAAALAAALIVTAAGAAVVQSNKKIYHLLDGNVITIPEDDYEPDSLIGLKTVCPVKVMEDGRVYIEDNGQSIDITGQFDEETPYIYYRTDPETGGTGIFAVGGTPEDIGWFEFYRSDNFTHYKYHNGSTEYIYLDGEWLDWDQITEEQYARFIALEPEHQERKTILDPWLAAVAKEINFSIR